MTTDRRRRTLEALPAVDDHTTRGQAIQARLDELSISDREFAERTGIDRKTLRRAVAGGEHVRTSTYRAIEAALQQLEATEEEPPLVSFELHAPNGMHVTVKGPASTADELRRQVAELVRDLRDRA